MRVKMSLKDLYLNQILETTFQSLVIFIIETQPSSIKAKPKTRTHTVLNARYHNKKVKKRSMY